jgi:hypothetical protein
MELVQLVLVAVFSAGGAYAAVRVELRFMRRDHDKLEKRVEGLEDREREKIYGALAQGHHSGVSKPA